MSPMTGAALAREHTSLDDRSDAYLRRGERQGAGVLTGQFRKSPRLMEGDAQRLRLALARAKQGDREALRYLYVRYADNIYGYIVSIVHDDHDAEDITQHVFAKLMTVVGRYEEREVPFSSWLLRLAHNAAVDHLRRRIATPVEEVRGADEATGTPPPDEMGALESALASLPPDQRTVVVLRHVVGLTPGEIASRLGRSENAIHGLHHRGRRALQHELLRLQSGPVTRACARPAA